MAERAAAERASSFNQASLENKSSMFGKLDQLARVGSYLRLTPDAQRQIAERMNQNERLALERVVAERAAQERISSERVSAERAMAERAAAERAATGRADQH